VISFVPGPQRVWLRRGLADWQPSSSDRDRIFEPRSLAAQPRAGGIHPIVDHHLDLALALSDRTVTLDRGQVTHVGPSKALSEDLDLRRKVLWL
jgi:hypothetical protein